MDLTYVFSACSYFATPDPATAPFTIHTARPRISPADPKVDEAMESTFTISSPSGGPTVHCHVKADMSLPPFLGFIPRFWEAGPGLVIETEQAKIELSNFVAPAYRHRVTVTEKGSGKKETTSYYKGGPIWKGTGEDWWTTYRWQLQAFTDAVRAKDAGRPYEGAWMSLDESEKLMEMIDAVYDKAGLPRRGL